MTPLPSEPRPLPQPLRSSVARFARLADAGILGLSIGNVHGDIFEANEAFLKLLGFDRNEFDGGAVRWSERMPPEWAEAHRAALDAIRRTGVAEPWEAELVHKDGHRVPVIIGIATLDYPNTIAIVTDLTSLRRRDGARRRMERTLEHAQKMDALANLAGGMAHEFNNLLSVILGYTGMLAADLETNDPTLDILDEIRTAGERAAVLTRQLLTLSPHQLVRVQQVDLSELVSALRERMRRLVGDDVDLVVETARVPAVDSDADLLGEAILHLVANARDAMPDGGVLRVETASIDVGTGREEAPDEIAPGAYVVIAVTDTGIGMDRATQARMFEPFFTTKGVGEGMGMGLSAVFGIVQRSGGSIRTESELGRGSVFRLYFPVAPSPADASHAEAHSGDATPIGGAETILVVEDEFAVRTLAASILRGRGYTVLEAGGAGEALLVCQRFAEPIHLVLTDAMLPTIAGRELVARLRAIRPRLDALYTSAYAAGAIHRHGVIDPGAAFLQKPFTAAALSRGVRRALDASARERNR